MDEGEVPTMRARRAAHGGLHLLSLCLSVAVWGLLVITVLCASDALPGTGSGGSCQALAPATFLVFLVLAYSLEVALSSTRRYLSSIGYSEDIISFIKRIRLMPPGVGFGIECSHLEERLETATADKWRYSTGDVGSTSEAWRKWRGKDSGNEPIIDEVATCRVTENFEYDTWKDVTGSAEWLRNTQYTVIKLHVNKAERPEFMDAQTEMAYGLKKRDFLEAHRDLDQRFELFDYVEVDGYQPIVLGLRSEDQRPWWLSCTAFYLFSLLGLTWPYRLYLGFRSLEASICVKKAIQCDVT